MKAAGSWDELRRRILLVAIAKLKIRDQAHSVVCNAVAKYAAIDVPYQTDS